MHAAYALQWSDSELASLTEHTPGTVCLRFSAAACRRMGDGLDGYLRPLELLFEGATWHADGPVLGCIAQGGLRLDGQPIELGPAAQAQGLPLPFDRPGVVACTLRLMSGTALHIDAERVVAQIADAASFRESCAC